jgi:Zn-dependent metalloprotease
VKAAPGESFSARDTVVDADGSEHVRFERSHEGLPVIGGDFVLHQRPGKPATASLTLRSALAPDMRSELQAADAILVARAAFGIEPQSAPEVDRVVYARGPAQPRLAWRVRLQGGESDETLLVAAQDGRLLDRWSNRETVAATGTGRTLYSGNVAIGTNSIAGGFELRDPARGGGYTINAATGIASGQIYKDATTAGATTRSATRLRGRGRAFRRRHHLGLLQAGARPQRHRQRRQGRREPRALRPQVRQRLLERRPASA